MLICSICRNGSEIIYIELINLLNIISTLNIFLKKYFANSKINARIVLLNFQLRHAVFYDFIVIGARINFIK